MDVSCDIGISGQRPPLSPSGCGTPVVLRLLCQAGSSVPQQLLSPFCFRLQLLAEAEWLMDSREGCPQAGLWVLGTPVGAPSDYLFCESVLQHLFSFLKVIFWGQVKTCSLPWPSVFLGPLSGLETFLLGPFSSHVESRPATGSPAQGFIGHQEWPLGKRGAGAHRGGHAVSSSGHWAPS